MGRPAGIPVFRFLPYEVAEMERVLEQNNNNQLHQQGCEVLAETFSSAPQRQGQTVQWKQVWNWFQNRRHLQKTKKVQPQTDAGATNIMVAPRVTVPAMPPYVRPHVPDETMEFEAKSSRDGAWYDVAMLLGHRDEQVLVRFNGLGPEMDEWVDVMTAVRQRSIACATVECVVVLKGDLVLCYQELNQEQALYYDAKVVDIQRRRHDFRGCRCRFWVKFLHDLSEEVVPLRKLCIRPEANLRWPETQMA